MSVTHFYSAFSPFLCIFPFLFSACIWQAPARAATSPCPRLCKNNREQFVYVQGSQGMMILHMCVCSRMICTHWARGGRFHDINHRTTCTLTCILIRIAYFGHSAHKISCRPNRHMSATLSQLHTTTSIGWSSPSFLQCDHSCGLLW